MPTPPPHLTLTVAATVAGFTVSWRLTGVVLAVDDPVGELPATIAGAPTIPLDDQDVSVTDDLGSVALTVVRAVDDEGILVRRWLAARPTQGAIELTHAATPVAAPPEAATPPLELRREGAGLSGALKCWVVLPTGPEELDFELRWVPPTTDDGAEWLVATSLGEGAGESHTGRGLERLGDTYVMCGDLGVGHHRVGSFSTWWLTDPVFDVAAFTARLGTTYGWLTETFDVPAHPYRVFVRTHPHRGVNASAHPSSFVMAENLARPISEESRDTMVAHELVHEWLHLDGADEETRWFAEGSADYYSLVVPLRAGAIDEDAFLGAVNLAARQCYANRHRDLTLREAEPLFFSDFEAHWLPYARGMFYLADLDTRIGRHTSGRRGVDDVVRTAVRRRREGDRVGVEEWCGIAERLLPGAELPVLDALVLTGQGRPGAGCFGPGFAMEVVDVPVLDLGFEPATLLAGRVQGLVPGGPAERAGLREGEAVEVPRYPDIVAMDVGDLLEVGVTRDGESRVVTIPLTGATTPVPQWRRVPREP